MSNLGGMRPAPDPDILRYQALRSVERRRNLKLHAAVYAVGMLALAVIWAITQYQNAGGWPHRFAHGNDRPGTWSGWIVWPLLLWTQILIVHALVTYVRRPTSEAEIARELERLGRNG